MSLARRIGPVAEATPPENDTAPTRPLPPDLLRAAATRLGTIALLSAVLWVIGTAAFHLVIRAMTGGDPRWWHFGLMDATALVCVVASLLLYRYTKRTTRDPAFILNLGLGYLVLEALGVGIVWHLEALPPGWAIQPAITWIGVMVLLFAAVVPSTPRKTLMVSLLAVSMHPVGMLIARERGAWPFDSLGDILLMHYPDYMMAGIAAVVSLVVTRLGQQIAKARELGSYQLGELLGRGGMGEVYRATHRMLARPAAIKLIRPEMIGTGRGDSAVLALRRFRREALVAANLQSPHTVAIYDFGVTDDGTLYIVMELLEGMTLDALVREQGPLPANRVIAILRQVAESLAEAHAAGVVHRDIKPANIHVGRRGLQHDFVKVLDFGLVKSVTGDPADQSLETAAGLMPGTPSFMAPEMALGEPYDGRADLYALGCVGYFLLTGHPVFQADSPLQVIARHLHAVPVPPSVRAGVPVPEALERLVMACLAKRPEERPRDAGELGRALSAIDEPLWTETNAAAWWKARLALA